MSKEKSENLDREDCQSIMINVLAMPVSSDDWDNLQYKNFTKKLRLFGFSKTDISGLFVKNCANPNDKVFSFLIEEEKRQSELPSEIFNFKMSISKSVDRQDFNTARNDGCLSKYADDDLVLTARWMNM